MKKTVAVLGLGKFGESVAKELSDSGCEVLAVDRNIERVQNISRDITHAVQADVCDTEAMEELGLSNMDAVVVAITENFNASILATIYAKDMGVKCVVAKAKDEVHTRVLKKVGADKIIIPERETGIRIAHYLISDNVVDFIELSKHIQMVEIHIPEKWVGKTLKQLNLRKQYGVNVVAKRKGQMELEISPDPDQPLEKESTLLIVGDKKAIGKLD